MGEKRKLEGHVAIVTGSAQGIGRGLAQRLDQEGCKLVLADINLEAVQKTAQSMSDAIAVEADVTNEDAVNAMVDTAIERFGTLDIMVANAGILIAKPVQEFSFIDWLGTIFPLLGIAPVIDFSPYISTERIYN